MNKVFSIIVLALFLFVSVVSASPSNKVDIVVVGMINHGPMQPTVNAIKQVTSKYPEVSVRWLDLESQEGQEYAQKHGLTAHLNILINGKYEYNINGKKVIFQWFEGQQWTKEDLDAVISNILNEKGNVTSMDNPKNSSNTNIMLIWVSIFAVIGAVAWFLIKKFRK